MKLIQMILTTVPFSYKSIRTRKILELVENIQKNDEQDGSLLVSQYASHNRIMKIYGLKDKSISIQLLFDNKKKNSIRKRELQSVHILKEDGGNNPGRTLYSISRIQSNITEYINPAIKISNKEFVHQVYSTIKSGISNISTGQFKA